MFNSNQERFVVWCFRLTVNNGEYCMSFAVFNAQTNFSSILFYGLCNLAFIICGCW